MNMKQHRIISRHICILLFMLSFPLCTALGIFEQQSSSEQQSGATAAGADQIAAVAPEPEIKVITDMQDAYNALKDIIPVFCFLPAVATSAVPVELVIELNQKLAKLTVTQGLIKPVVMTTFLHNTFVNKKAESPFTFFQALNDERYSVPLQGICRPYIFKNGEHYVLRLAFYSLKGSAYPIEILRSFTNPQELHTVINTCLQEFAVRSAEKPNNTKKKIIINEFKIELRKLVELESGEFDFVTVPFIQQHTVALKDGDDYFSTILGYVLSSSNLFETMRLADFKEYAETNISSNNNADYIIKGRIQLSDQLCFLYIDVLDARRGNNILSIKHPVKEFSLSVLWKAYGEIATLIAEKVLPAGSFYPVKPLYAIGSTFYYQNKLIGWDTLEYFFLPKGMHVIETGNTLNTQPKPTHQFFILLDTQQHLFTDKEGNHAWNLLQK